MTNQYLSFHSFAKVGWCLICFVIPVLVLLNSCSNSSESFKSDVQPAKAIAISTSPAISISECHSLDHPVFLSPKEFTDKGKTYRLIGIALFSDDIADIPEQYMQTLSEEAFCMRTDPSLEGTDLVYVFSNKDSLINARILKDGYGKKEPSLSDYVYENYMDGIATEAEIKKEGLWSSTNNNHFAYSSRITSETPYTLITPQEVPNFIDKNVTLRLKIRSVGHNDQATYFNSNSDYKDPNNVAVVILQPIEDPSLLRMVENASSYEGKYINASGRITLYKGAPQILIKHFNQLEFIEVK